MDKNSVKLFIKEVERTEDPYYDKKELIKLLKEFDRFVGMTEEKKEVIVSLKRVIYKMNIGESFSTDDTPMSILIMGQQGIGKTEFSKIYAKLIMCVCRYKKPDDTMENMKPIISKSSIFRKHNFTSISCYIFSSFFLLLSLVYLFIGRYYTEGSKKVLNILIFIVLAMIVMCSLDFFFNIEVIFRYLETGSLDVIVSKPIKKLYISEPYVILRKADLVGSHIGETSIITRDTLNRHKGKAIIIDEFYDILRHGESDRSFGPECITAIMEFMDNNPNNPIFFLGYEEDLKSGILKSQKGFARRCGVKITLKKYTPDELYTMFVTKLEDNGLEMKKDTKKEVSDLFKNNSTYLVNYGGDVRLLVGKITDNIAEKYYNATKKHTEVTISHVKQAFNKLIKDNSSVTNTESRIGSLIDVY